MPWRWAFVCLACAVWGCALLDQPVVEAPTNARAKSRSPYEPLVSVCECSAERAESDLNLAVGALEPNVKDRLEAPAFDSCVNALTGVPSVAPLLPVVPGSRSFSDVRQDMARAKLRWSLWLEPDGRADVFVQSKTGARFFDLEQDVRVRILPTLRTLESAHLGSQLCHATALFVAIEAQLSRDRSQQGVVSRLANTARRLDGVAAASTGIFLELRRIARSDRVGPLRVKGLRFDGEFASDGDDVERNAARQVQKLVASGTHPKPGNSEPYAKDVALPLWLAPRPNLSELCASEAQSDAAMKAGLPALRDGDLGTLMLAARSLYGSESTARQGLVTVCAILGGNDEKALSAARDMVPGYTSTGQFLSTLSLEPG